MRKPKLVLFSCHTCQFHYVHMQQCEKADAVMLEPGKHYCMHETAARLFKHAEIKSRPPSWCSLRISPLQVNIYGFRDDSDEIMFRLLNDCNSDNLHPDPRRYMLISQHTTTFSIETLWNGHTIDEGRLNIKIPLFGIVGLNDGLREQLFFKYKDGFNYQPFLDLQRE